MAVLPRRRPALGATEDEVERLRRSVVQHELALARLTDAMLALRRGGQALREENRELRRELEAATAGRGGRSRSLHYAGGSAGAEG